MKKRKAEVKKVWVHPAADVDTFTCAYACMPRYSTAVTGRLDVAQIELQRNAPRKLSDCKPNGERDSDTESAPLFQHLRRVPVGLDAHKTHDNLSCIRYSRRMAEPDSLFVGSTGEKKWDIFKWTIVLPSWSQVPSGQALATFRECTKTLSAVAMFNLQTLIVRVACPRAAASLHPKCDTSGVFNCPLRPRGPYTSYMRDEIFVGLEESSSSDVQHRVAGDDGRLGPAIADELRHGGKDTNHIRVKNCTSNALRIPWTLGAASAYNLAYLFPGRPDSGVGGHALVAGTVGALKDRPC
ncbi:hypothetical protein BJV78DRAFT_1154307 [Lactifluus subvellereus]|nr:hypothetical protein BJV78DRAFT_1154307 [Lactifluus subvellereus]